MQLLKHVANAMQCAEGFVLESALVAFVVPLISMHMASAMQCVFNNMIKAMPFSVVVLPLRVLLAG